MSATQRLETADNAGATAPRHHSDVVVAADAKHLGNLGCGARQRDRVRRGAGVAGPAADDLGVCLPAGMAGGHGSRRGRPPVLGAYNSSLP